jgi:hypothetical protein
VELPQVWFPLLLWCVQAMAMFGSGPDAMGGVDDVMGKMDQLKASLWNLLRRAC